MAQEFKVIQGFYDFMLWLIGHARRQLEQQYQELPASESLRARARRPLQLLRVSDCDALLRQALPTWNRRVYGPGECGGESPGVVPESSVRLAGRPNLRCWAGRVWYPAWRTPCQAPYSYQYGDERRSVA